MEHIYLCGITACPPSAEIHKSALGAEDTVEWTYFENTLDAIRSLQKNGYNVWAVEQAEGAVNLERFHPGKLTGSHWYSAMKSMVYNRKS